MKNNHYRRIVPLCLILLMTGGCAHPLIKSSTLWAFPDKEAADTQASADTLADASSTDSAADDADIDPLFSLPDPEQPMGPTQDNPPPRRPMFPLSEGISGTDEGRFLQTILANFSPPLPVDGDQPSGQVDADQADDGGEPNDGAAAGDDRDALDTPDDQDLANASQPNLWNRIRAGMKLHDSAHRRINMEVHWFADHQGYLDRTAERAKYYLYFVANEVAKRHMPMELTLLPIVESAYQPFAYSHGRAAGIWQFIPSTARVYGLKQNWWYDGRRDVIASTRAALDYLQQLHDRFNDDWLLALAAYNSGAGTVDYAIRRNKRRGRPITFWSLRLPSETRGYVPRLLAIAKIIADPAKYDVSLTPIPDKPYFATVKVGSQIDLALVAKLAQLPLNEVYRLNPGFNRWATAPKGPHRILIPVDNADKFRQGLADLGPRQRIHWIRHRVHQGETLGYIALHYHTTVSLIRRVNKLRGNLIRAGHYLTVPVASKRLASYTLSAEQRRRAIQSNPKGSRKINHQVVAGDTLWDIARHYQVSVRHLASWNGIAPTDPLHPGQHLVIWTRHREAAASLAKTMLAGPDRQVATRRITYHVKRGDSLSRISQRFNVTVTNLQRWNGLHGHHYLQPGQKLTLYVNVTELGDNI
ncbi:MAG TPA: LysM peptidoglycan-binding domain-containing protein [Gammaproteobacteria bacterium]|nr:LysM peptidoglycan-binding domain-containing protein [Gammaproteobacteria bacterium]